MGFIVLVQDYNEAIIVTKKKSKSSCVVCSLTWFDVWCLHTNENWIHPPMTIDVDITYPSIIHPILHQKNQFPTMRKKLWMFIMGSLWALKGDGCTWLQVWKDLLPKNQCLENSNDKLWRGLHISFDSLELDKKKMLLDVVCFFNEYQVEYG